MMSLYCVIFQKNEEQKNQKTRMNEGVMEPTTTTATTASQGASEENAQEAGTTTGVPGLRGAELWDPGALLALEENSALRAAVDTFVALVACDNAEFARLRPDDRTALVQASLAEIDRVLAETLVGRMLSRPQLKAACAAMRRLVFVRATPRWRSPELDQQDRAQHEHMLALQRFVTPQFLHVPAAFVRHPFFNDAVTSLFICSTCTPRVLLHG